MSEKILSKACCCICGFLLDTEISHEHKKAEKIRTWYDFIVQKEHLFIRNIYTKEEISSMENLSTLESYCKKFNRFLGTIILLKKYFNRLTTLNNDDDQQILKEFFTLGLNDEFEDICELRDSIDDFNVIKKFGKYDYIDEIIGLVYSNIMKFKKTENIKGLVLSFTFIDNVKGLIDNQNVIHHSHIIGEFIGYTHSFCNLKVKENQNKISVIAHNLFGFDFFFLFKRRKGWILENKGHFYRR